MLPNTYGLGSWECNNGIAAVTGPEFPAILPGIVPTPISQSLRSTNIESCTDLEA